MSGILGLYRLDGAPADRTHVDRMAGQLAHRGPDRVATWVDGPVGLGHALLATTRAAAAEHLPLVHGPSGCTITADVRLDNRDELLRALGLAGGPPLGDAEIVLEAYLRWGDSSPARLLGDFAFAIWDPRRRTVLCARDHLGMRQLLYHHRPGHLLAFATDSRALLAVPDVPHRLNEARIADYLVPRLEGIDTTSTFFEEILRLPPAHTLVVSRDGAWRSRYWRLEPGPELRLGSDAAYAEAFLDVFRSSLRSRLSSVEAPGSMMSGGLDSSSAAAHASHLLRSEGGPRLRTFSGVGPRGATDPETRSVEAMLGLDGVEPTTVSHASLDAIRPELERLARHLDEPFDGGMAIIQALYITARDAGVRTLLDGVSGDIVLADGQGVARLIRAGRWRSAHRELLGENRFWDGDTRPHAALLGAIRAAYAPPPLRRIRQHRRQHAEVARALADGPMSPDLADRVSLAERLRTIDGYSSPLHVPDRRLDRSLLIGHPYVAIGRERYDRVAAAVGIEPRDPYLDRRVVAFCADLPDRQLTRDGWPKRVLRVAGDGVLPDAVRWRRGRTHLGWEFTDAVMGAVAPTVWRELLNDLGPLEAFVDAAKARTLLTNALAGGVAIREEGYSLCSLALWVRHHAERPTMSHNQGRTRS